MLGNMQDKPLLISGLLVHGETVHAKQQIVSRTPEGKIHRYTFADLGIQVRKAANVLAGLGISKGDCIATLAWNTNRHLEVYMAVSGSGAVLHTVNPRLFADQLIYIMNHAEDKVLFLDTTFVPLVEQVADKLESVQKYVVLTDSENMPESSLDLLCYGDLMADASADYEWPEFDENQAAALCYTSGTTGNPKGVMYSHRSTVLHAWGVSGPSSLGVSDQSCILPVVPMFHVNAWGIPYAALMHGAKLVLPGPNLDGASIYELIKSDKPDVLMGVPTVWLGLLNHLDEIGAKLEGVRSVIVGGSAAPLSMIRAFDEKHGAFLLHAWGMTEMSPLGTVNVQNNHWRNLGREERWQLQTKQGQAMYGVEMRIADDEGNSLPHDGKAFGRLQVRGPWILERYFKSNESALDKDGWFDTGDVSTIDQQGYMQIVDRAKDVIKSGGEWISSIELENIAVGHSGVSEACVIGVPHPKWDERPLLLIVRNGQQEVSKDGLLEFLAPKLAKWTLPDDVIFVDELPHTATGKLQKNKLRDQYQGHLLS